jgi:SAM-dependent methyltransferase
MEQREYYADPERYEAEYAPFSIDRAWYVKRAVELGGPVLELGCGTGRILFALAAEGLKVSGIDNAPAMLARARSRAVLLGADVARRVELLEAELTAFSLGRKFRSIVAPLNCLMHLLSDDDLLACLAQVHEHLEPDGRFLFDLSLPREELFEETGGPEGVPLRTLSFGGVQYLQRELHVYDPDTRISATTYTFGPTACASPGACTGQTFQTSLRLRLIPPAEIEDLLERAGFALVERYGDFKQNPPDLDEDIMQLLVAKAR